jgi:hypothetical protein
MWRREDQKAAKTSKEDVPRTQFHSAALKCLQSSG